MSGTPRLLVLGAHPDDAEFQAGGLIAAYAARGNTVRLVSVTDGGAGHHRLSPAELVAQRRREAAQAGTLVGAAYETWEFSDARLAPTMELRDRIIRDIRTFQPDLVLTHRPCDYHPDHRAVGQAVQDASYLVTVPLVVPDVPHLSRDPVVAYMCDAFTRPYPFQADVVRDVSQYLDVVLRMLACHSSQVFEFLPHNQGGAAEVPQEEAERMRWLRDWYGRLVKFRVDRFRGALVQEYGEAAYGLEWVEAFEISEYAAALAPADRERLFPR